MIIVSIDDIMNIFKSRLMLSRKKGWGMVPLNYLLGAPGVPGYAFVCSFVKNGRYGGFLFTPTK